MAEQLNFRVARIGQAAHFRENRIAGAAAFGPARVRHHAIRAGIVAAFDDREIRAERIVAARDFSFECFVGIEVEARDAAAARFHLLDQIRQIAIARRAAHQAHPRRALENFFAFLLRDAAEHANHFLVRLSPRI